MNANWPEMLVGLSPLGDTALRVTLVLAIGWILHLVLVRSNPRWRVLLWRCTAVGVALVPVLVCSIPRVPLTIQASTTQTAALAPAADPLLPIDPPTVDLSDPAPGADNLLWMVDSLPEPSPTDTAAAPSTPPAHWAMPGPWAILLAGWLVGLMVLSIRWVFSQTVLRRELSHCRKAPASCRRLAKQVAAQMGVSGVFHLLKADNLDVPFVAGIWRRVVVLPTSMCGAAYAGELPGILAHELSHHRSRDLAWMALIQWTGIACWMHPLAWRIGRAHATACEEVADTNAARLVGDAQQYSAALARVALSAYRIPPATAAIPMARSPEVIARLARLKRGLLFVPLSRKRVCSSVVVGIFALVGLVAFQVVLADTQASSEGDSRVIPFPADHSVGKLWIATAEESSWMTARRAIDYHPHWDWICLGQARGTVKVPAAAKVKLNLNAPGAQDMSWTTRLDPNALHTVEVLGSEWGGAPFGDAQIQHFSRFTGLEELGLRVTQVTDRGLRSLEPLQSLKVLELNTPNIGANGLKSLGQLKSLESLSLGVTGQCDAAGLTHLTNLKSLREFVFGAPSVPPAALARIAQLPSLMYIWSSREFTDEHLAALKAAKALKGLRIPGANVTDAGLRHLTDMKSLEYVDLWHTGISDAGLVHLKALPNLKRLNVRVMSTPGKPLVTARGVAQLAEIPSLEYLDLPNFDMTDECCEYVSRLPNLKHLWIGCYSSSPITDEGVKHLARLKHLESLSIGGTRITDAGMAYIGQLQNLATLGVAMVPRMTDAGLASLAALKKLKSLELPRENGFSTPGARHLNGLSDLRVLNLRLENTPHSDEPPLDLSTLAELRELTLDGARDVDLASLGNLKHLECLLTTYRSQIGDEGIAHLSRLTSLQRLTIGGPKMTDAGLASLTGLKNVNNLWVRGRFSDTGLAHLKALQALEVLRIESTERLSPNTGEILHKELPSLCLLNLNDQRVLAKSNHSDKLGTKAPGFQATALDGTKLRLDDYRGKVLLLYFWATWCKPCVASTEVLKQNYVDTRGKHPDFEMIALSCDDGDLPVKQHVARYRLPWKQLRIGQQSKIASDYGVTGVPRYVLIDRDGYIQFDGHMSQQFIQVLTGALSQKPSPVAKTEREWTDDTGKHHTKARLLKVENGQARLEKPDGSVISVPLDKLSEADRQFINTANRK